MSIKYDEYVSSRLAEISELRYNWDGYESQPIPENVIGRARALVQSLADEEPKLFPTLRGSIHLERVYPHGKYLKIEVSEYSIVCFCEVGNQTVYAHDVESLERAVKWWKQWRDLEVLLDEQ